LHRVAVGVRLEKAVMITIEYTRFGAMLVTLVCGVVKGVTVNPFSRRQVEADQLRKAGVIPQRAGLLDAS